MYRKLLTLGVLLTLATMVGLAALHDRKARADSKPAAVAAPPPATAKPTEVAPALAAPVAPKRAKLERDDLDRLGLLTAGINRLTATEQEAAIRYDVRTRDLPEAARVEARKKHELSMIGVRAERDEKVRERVAWADRVARARDLEPACFVLLADATKAKTCGPRLWGIGEDGAVVTAADASQR